MAPGWNAPRGVENGQTLCAGEPESDDQGNALIHVIFPLNCLDTSSMYQELYKLRIIFVAASPLEQSRKDLLFQRPRSSKSVDDRMKKNNRNRKKGKRIE